MNLKINYKVAISIVLLTTNFCCIETETVVHLTEEYSYWNSRITTNSIVYCNNIFQIVTDCIADDKFILAEQNPKESNYVTLFGANLIRRYEVYKNLITGSKVSKEPYYLKAKNIILRDSLLYKEFNLRGANENEQNNLHIGVWLAEDMIKNEKRFANLFDHELHYWIIELSKDSLIGPLNKEAYLKTKVILNVPSNLKLKFEK